MKQIYLMRHGQSVANAEKWTCGQIDSPLTTLGIEQAKTAGQIAKDKNMDFDLIVSSPLGRAMDTARTIAEAIGYPSEEIVVIEELKERYLGELQGKPWPGDTEPTSASLSPSDVPGIEPRAELHFRVLQAYEQILKLPGEKVLIVCHNGVGRMLQVVAAHEDPELITSHPRLENGQFYKLL